MGLPRLALPCWPLPALPARGLARSRNEAQNICVARRFRILIRRVAVGQAVLVVVAFSALVLSASDQLTNVPEGVERYARDMDAVMKSPGPISLEPVFGEGLSAAKALEHGQLEQFDESTYTKVRAAMAGFVVIREEVIVAAPLADFFLKLAHEKGTSIDQAFFENQKKTYPDSFWPAYREPQTDFGGCTVFDGKTITGLYGLWTAFQQAYPGHYREATQRELSRVEEELASTCACKGEDSVRKELENFLKIYPRSLWTAKVAARLQTLKTHTSGIRFYCRAG